MTASDNETVAELRRRLKVAEDALTKIRKICAETEYAYGRIICDNALAAIRAEEGEGND